MCEIADLPCVCTRREYLRSAYGCAVLVQPLAHAQLLGAPLHLDGIQGIRVEVAGGQEGSDPKDQDRSGNAGTARSIRRAT